MDQAIVVDKLKKNYGELVAVNELSFSVKKGELFGLLGPNGAGKTTTLSMLTGIIQPTGGSLNILGLDVGKDIDKIKKLIGYVPQSLALYPTLTAKDNLSFFCGIYGLSGNLAKERIQMVLETVKLTDRANDIVETFSGGMKRRLNIAVGLLHQPQVLFLDEPTVGIDPQSRNAIFDAIEELQKNGVTIIYTTHYMEEAQRLCQRVAIMDKGQVIALDSPSSLCQSVGKAYFRVETSAGDSAALLSDLGKASSIREASIKENALEVSAVNLQEALISFMRMAHENNVQILSLKIFEPTLETVFLKLTGKDLRDDL